MKVFTIITILFLLTSCWPKSVSFTDSGSMPVEWKSFSVKTLELSAPNAPVSYAANLSESIKDGVQNNTRLLLNPKSGSGEISIEGIISNYSITPIAIQPGDNAAKNRLSISVNFSIFITKPKEDKMVVTSTRFVDYYSDVDFSSKEAELLEEINKQIVQDVINKLFSNW
jgi:hypothetical protein